MSKFFKHGILVLLAIVLILSVIAIIGFFYRPSVIFPGLKDYIAELASNKLQSDIQIEAVEGDFFSGLKVHDIVFIAENEPYMRVEECNVSFDFFWPWEKEIRIRNLEILGGFCNIESMKLPKGKDTGKPFYFDLPKLHFDDFNIHYDQYIFPLEVYASMEKKDVLSMQIDSLFCHSSKSPLPNLSIFHGRLAQHNSVLQASDFGIILGNSFGDLNFLIDLNNRYHSNLSITAHVVDETIFNKDLIAENAAFDIVGFPEANQFYFSSKGSISYFGKEIQNAEATFDLNNAVLRILNANIESSNERVQLSGFRNMNTKEVELNAIARNVDFPTLLPETSLDGNIKLESHNEDLLINFDLSKLSYYDNDFSNVKGTFSFFDSSIVLIDTLELNSYDSFCKIHKLNFAPKSLQCSGEIKLVDFNLEKLVKKGPDAISAEVQFDYFDLDNNRRLNSEFEIENFVFSNSNIEKISSEFSIRKSPESQISGDFHSTLQGFDATPFSLDTLKIGGKIEGDSLRVNGRAMNSEDANSLDFSVVSDLRFETFWIDSVFADFNRIPLRIQDANIQLINNTIITPDLEIGLANGTLDFSGRYGLNGDYNFDLFIEKLDIAAINQFLSLKQRQSGVITSSVQVRNLKQQPVITSDITIRNGQIMTIEFDSLSGKLAYNDSRFILSGGQLEKDGNAILADGWYTISECDSCKLLFNEGDSLHIDLSLRDFELSLLNAIFPFEQKFGGSVNGDIQISSSVINPIYNLDLTIDNPIFDRIVGSKLKGNAKIQDRVFYLENSDYISKYGNYKLDGYFPVDLGLLARKRKSVRTEPINLVVMGEGNRIEFLTPYFPEIESFKGEFHMQLALTGSWGEIIRNGTIKLENGNLSLLPLENSISDISALVNIENNILNIYSMEAYSKDTPTNSFWDLTRMLFPKKNDDKANITVSGSMDMTSFFRPDFDVQISAKKMFLDSSEDLFEGNGDCNFSITGKDTLSINGIFTPDSRNFRFTSEFDRNDVSIDKIESAIILDYNIHIPIDDGIRVRNSYMDLFVDGELNIVAIGNEDFRYAGNLNVLEGSFTLNGIDYSGTEGTVILDPSEFNPELNLHTSTSIGDEIIDISFLGNLDNPNLLLESSSGFSQDDILRILLLGEKQNDSQDQVILNQATNVMTNLIQRELERYVTETGPIDQFKMSGSGNLLKGEDSELSFYIGTNISRNWFVNVQSDVVLQNSTFEYELGYRINRNMTMVAKLDKYGYYNFKYRLKKRY